jgi:hypothetical protein
MSKIKSPKGHTRKIETLILAGNLIGCGVPFRAVAQKVEIPKSTLYDNRVFLQSLAEDVDSGKKPRLVSDREIVRHVLSLTLEGGVTSRKVGEVLKTTNGISISQSSVLKVLNLAEEPIKALSKLESQNSLKYVKCLLADETFSAKSCLLVAMDYYSSYLVAVEKSGRSGDDWAKVLNEGKVNGLNPSLTITDGGTGLLSGLNQTLPATERVPDMWHLLRDLSQGISSYRKMLYALIGKEHANIQKNPQVAEEARQLFELRECCLQELEKLYVAFRFQGKFSSNQGRYHTASEYKVTLETLVASLEKAHKLVPDLKKLKKAYLGIHKNQETLLLVKSKFEAQIEEISKVHATELKAVLGPAIDHLQHSFRDSKWNGDSKEDLKVKVFAACFKASILLNGQATASSLFEFVFNTARRLGTANSLIEGFNGVVQRAMYRHHGIPKWFPTLIRWYWNHHRFQRGKRKGSTPFELLTDSKEITNWLEPILDLFPYEKLHLDQIVLEIQ